jgi:uncharacterized membrane-anchored protein
MIKLYTITILTFLSVSVFGQTIDQNGRTPAQQKISATVSVQEVSLQEDATAKTNTSFTLKYILPAGKTSGEIMLFHPKADQILKKISLNQQQGTIEVSTKDLPVAGVVAALYSENILLKSKTVKLVH